MPCRFFLWRQHSSSQWQFYLSEENYGGHRNCKSPPNAQLCSGQTQTIHDLPDDSKKYCFARRLRSGQQLCTSRFSIRICQSFLTTCDWNLNFWIAFRASWPTDYRKIANWYPGDGCFKLMMVQKWENFDLQIWYFSVAVFISDKSNGCGRLIHNFWTKQKTSIFNQPNQISISIRSRASCWAKYYLLWISSVFAAQMRYAVGV